MTDTPNLALPLIAPAQAQKHVTHNEAIARLDALTQLAVLDRDLAAPPGSPADGDRYLVAAGATGAWAGRDGAIAWFDATVWRFLAPALGWIVWVVDEAVALARGPSGWVPLVGLNPAPMIGVNATADATNRLALASPASLFSHAGAGHQLKINKSAAGDAASLLFQTGFVARAEIGVVGDDDLRMKTLGDDAAWRDAAIIDRKTARVAFPHTPFGENWLVNGDFSVNQRGFAGGALAAGAYGFDRWKAGPGGATLSVAGGAVTLTSGSIAQTVEAGRGPWRMACFSVEDLSGGALDVTIGGATQTLAPGVGRRGLTFDLSAQAETSDLVVALAPAAGAVSFRRAKLEQGAAFSAWRGRARAEEFALCRRYFQIHRGGFALVAPAPAQAAGAGFLTAPMRATPTPSMSGSAVLSFPAIGSATATAAHLGAFAMRGDAAFEIAFASGAPATAAGQTGFLLDATLVFSAEL